MLNIVAMPLQEKIQSLKKHYEKVLDDIGEDKNREGLLNTPERVAKSMVFLTAGYEMDPVAIINSAKFKEDYHDMVLIKDTEFYSMCEHHMLPFFGKVHVAYVPDGEIVGLSKIPRIIDVFARRLQVQERNQGVHREHTPSKRGGGRGRGTAPLHADERCAEARGGH